MAVMKELLPGQGEQLGNNPQDCTTERDAADDLAMCEVGSATWLLNAIEKLVVNEAGEVQPDANGNPITSDALECVIMDEEADIVAWLGDDKPETREIAQAIINNRTALPYWIKRCLAAESKHTVVGFSDIEACVKSVLPDADFSRTLHVHPGNRATHLPTLAQAQEVAAAIVAQYGGSVEATRFDEPCGSGVVGSVKVTTCGIGIPIFFFDEEAAPCSAS